jgi:DNA-binding GntR family transcriptional regulator
MQFSLSVYSSMPETILDRPNRNALQERSYKLLKRKILEGAIKPGQRLSEPELAAMLGVSRSPIREAVLRLERDGFIVRGASGRLSAAPLNVEEIEQLYVLRAHLEGLTARLATPRLRAVDLDEMAEYLAIQRSAVLEGDRATVAKVGNAFHAVILRECGNKPLVDTLGRLNDLINRFRLLAISFDDHVTRINEHQSVLEHFTRRDTESAEAAMIEHIKNSGTALLANVRRALVQKESDGEL